MPERTRFIVELWRRQPWGLLLQGFAFVSLGSIGYYVVSDTEIPDWLHRVGIAALASLAIGMGLTHRAAHRLQLERRSQDHARSPAPWEQ